MKRKVIYFGVLLSFMIVTSFKTSHKDPLIPKEVEKAFEKALEFAENNLDKPHFLYQFAEDKEKGLYNTIKVDMDYGSFFCKGEKFLILTCEYRRFSDDKYYRVYLEKDNEFELKISEQENYGMPHLIKEINGDGNTDFVIPYSVASGCCPKRRERIFLYENKNFIKYDFINPTFSPKEKVVRGVLYGYFPEVGLYKYKWNVTKLDTVEYIYRTKESNYKKFIRTKNYKHLSEENQKESLDSLPSEYQNIDEIEWFLRDE